MTVGYSQQNGFAANGRPPSPSIPNAQRAQFRRQGSSCKSTNLKKKDFRWPGTCA